MRKSNTGKRHRAFNDHCVSLYRLSKKTSSAFSIVVAVAQDPITFSGLLKPHETDGLETSRTTNRYFCPDYRSPRSAAREVMHGTIFLKAGTLDAASWLQPELNM